MPSLTRAEAADRAALLSVRGYLIELQLGADDYFVSSTTVEFDAARDGHTFVDVAAARLHSVRLDNRELPTGGLGGARMPVTLTRGPHRLVVAASMAYSHDGEGLVRHVDPADGRTYLYAMSFLDAAPRWFACFDQPDLKAPVRIAVTCPPDWIVAGNGPAVQVAPGHWRLEQRHPIATYMTTLIAGPYVTARSEHDGIPLAIHARASLADALDRDAADLFEHTARSLDECHRLFGARYPWGEYHQAFVPDFNAGAMENPGCVTFRDQLMFRSQATRSERSDRNAVVSHEMAHMWFGDLVTMRWWDDLWLNESFAEYVGHRVCDTLGDDSAWHAFGIERKAWGYAADRRPSTHPIAGTGAVDTAAALDAFDGISYAKGASALRQLAARLGEDVFLGGLRAHIAGNAFGNAELADLLRAWRDAGAADIDAWAQAWLRTSGLDTLEYVDGAIARTGDVAREHAITVGAFGSDGAQHRVPLLVRSDRTPVELPPAQLVLPDATNLTWAKIALGNADWRRLVTMLAELDPTARIVVWTALQLAVADAEIAPALALDIVANAIPHEQLDHVVGNVLAWAATTAVTYAGNGALHLVASAARAALDAATPEHRLVAARAVIATAGDAALLREWLSGDLPDGVPLDDDVRWRLLVRLCELGACGPDEIEAARAADDSSEGARRAAQCRAALPDAAAKEAAWRLLMTDTSAANSILYATASGFWQPTQAGLLDDFVPRYFEEIAGTAELRSGWVVGRLASMAFPWTFVADDTVARSERLLRRSGLASGIRRSVADRTDDLRRALTSRKRFDPHAA